jgi:hypothetical protein
MENPKYLVNIYYSNPVRTGSTGASVNDIWQTYPVMSGGWYVATMPEVSSLFATGSTYGGALSALLAMATASNNNDAAQGPAKN